MRMFAGPNGSGKSTLKTVLQPELIGIYLNPDDIEKQIASNGIIDLAQFGIKVTNEQVSKFFESSELLQKGTTTDLEIPRLEGTILTVDRATASEYQAAAVTEFIRYQLIHQKTSFTFETVMSHESKIDFLRYAHEQGFRTYLYYIATSDPIININRVKNRVKLGGHPVLEEKIRSRYTRSLALLLEAIRNTDRAYIFDNSFESRDASSPTWIAEITEGKQLRMESDSEPAWFKAAVLDKL
ncbi:MAG TPA: hypothetical protein VIX80_08615 [Candidatus Kapabacteria bacterium]